MKDRIHLLSLFIANTGKTTATPVNETKNPYGYQVSRVGKIRRYGGVEE